MFGIEFSGYLSRSKYWKSLFYWYLIFPALALLCLLLFGALSLSAALILLVPAAWIYWFIVSLARLGVTIRRCNDAGIHPFFSILTCIPGFVIPFVGFFAILIIGILPSKEIKEIESTRTPSNELGASYEGLPSLENPSYQRYLEQAYSVQYIYSLQQYSCNGKLFSSIQEALEFAKLSDESLVIEKFRYTTDVPRQSFNEKLKGFKIFIAATILIASLFVMYSGLKENYYQFQIPYGSLEYSSELPNPLRFFTPADYREHKNNLLMPIFFSVYTTINDVLVLCLRSTDLIKMSEINRIYLLEFFNTTSFQLDFYEHGIHAFYKQQNLTDGTIKFLCSLLVFLVVPTKGIIALLKRYL